jgi:uncharacterized membrane protein YkoI
MKKLLWKRTGAIILAGGMCVLSVLGTQPVSSNAATNVDLVASATSSSSEKSSSSSSSSSTKNIGLSAAKKKALKDAGLSSSDVTYTKGKLTKEDGVSVYDIEFYTDTAEYEYEIKATSGKILEKSWEKFAPTKTTTKTTKIGVSAAKKKALKDAGFTSSQVTFKKAKLDTEDGIRVYEVEFYKGQAKYDYEIQAYTGEILSYSYDAN